MTIENNLLMRAKGDEQSLHVELVNLLSHVEQNPVGPICPELNQIRKLMSGTADSTPSAITAPKSVPQASPAPQKKSTADLFKEINEERMQRGKMAPPPMGDGPKRGGVPPGRGHGALGQNRWGRPG